MDLSEANRPAATEPAPYEPAATEPPPFEPPPTYAPASAYEPTSTMAPPATPDPTSTHEPPRVSDPLPTALTPLRPPHPPPADENPPAEVPAAEIPAAEIPAAEPPPDAPPAGETSPPAHPRPPTYEPAPDASPFEAPTYPPPAEPPSTPDRPAEGTGAPVMPIERVGPQEWFDGVGESRNRLGLLSIVVGAFAVLWDCCVGSATRAHGAAYGNLVFVVAAFVLGYLHVRKVRAGTAGNVNLARTGIGLGLLALLLTVCLGNASSANYFYDHMPFNSLGIAVKLLIPR